MLKWILAAIYCFTIISYNAPHASCETAAHFGQVHIELVNASLSLVQNKFPEWYQEGVDIDFDLHDDDNNLAYAHRAPNKEMLIRITQHGLKYCETSDMEALFLHEYVHLKIWEELALSIPNHRCNTLRHELVAHSTVLQAADKLNYTPRMRTLTMELYERYHWKARLHCDAEIYEDLPRPAEFLEWPS